MSCQNDVIESGADLRVDSDDHDGSDVITLMTYGKRFGSIDKSKCEKVWNCTVVANPACERKKQTGLLKKFREEVLRDTKAQAIVDEATQYIVDAYALDDAECQVFSPCRLAFFCEHGKHRSVAIAERVAERLRLYKVPVEVVHRDVHRSTQSKKQTKRARETYLPEY